MPAPTYGIGRRNDLGLSGFGASACALSMTPMGGGGARWGKTPTNPGGITSERVTHTDGYPSATPVANGALHNDNNVNNPTLYVVKNGMRDGLRLYTQS